MMQPNSHQETEDEDKDSCCNCWLKRYCWDDSNNKFPPIRTATILISLLFYIIDIGSDVYVAYEHCTVLQSDPDPNAGHYFNFIATVVLIVVPNIAINFLSWILYTLGYMKSRRVPPEDVDGNLEFSPIIDSMNIYKYICISFIHLFLLGHFFRFFRLLFKRKKDHYSFDRYRDISVLRLMEASLESAPQLLLQFYIIVVTGETWLTCQIIFTSISIGVSTISLALAVADYTSAVKDLNYYDPPPEHDCKPRLSWTGYFLLIFWHLFMIVGRAIAFVLFASVHGLYLFIMIGVHYAAMVYWMYWQQANVFNRDYEKKLGLGELICKKHICGNYGIEFLAAALNIFSYFKLNRGSSIKTLVPFYVLVFVENMLMILLWFIGRDDFDVYIGYEIPLFVAGFVTFFLGLICLSIYYKFCQPNNRASLKRNSFVVHPTLKLPNPPLSSTATIELPGNSCPSTFH